MSISDWEKIVITQVEADLSFKGLTLGDFNEKEKFKMKYEMALKLLKELG